MAKQERQAKGKRTGGNGYGRSAVTLHREGFYGAMRPAVNVKVRGSLRSVDYAALRRVNGTGTEWGQVPAWFDWEWIEANVSEKEMEDAWNAALESGWEQMQQDAEEAFRGVPGTRRRVQESRGKWDPEFEPGVRVWGEGRSGGWAIVEGLPDFEPEGGEGAWDAVMLGRWRRFEGMAQAGAARVPEEAALILAGWAVDNLERSALEEYTG